MILSKLRLICKNQKGFTLVEMLMVVTLVGLLSTGITAALMQLLTINSRSSNHMIAVRQVQQAGKEVSKDALQAQSVDASGSSGFPLTLTWDEWGTNDTHEVIYDLVDMPYGEYKKLQRSHSVNDEEPTVTLVAEHIDLADTNCYPLGVLPPNGKLIFTVTATVGDQSETRVYEIEPRPS